MGLLTSRSTIQPPQPGTCGRCSVYAQVVERRASRAAHGLSVASKWMLQESIDGLPSVILRVGDCETVICTYSQLSECKAEG